MRIIKLIYTAIFSVLTLSAYGFNIDMTEDYERLVFTDSLNNSMPYRMLSPNSVEHNITYPLVVFLHGSGERGTDNEKQLAHGSSIFSNPANVDKYPAYVVFPQCKEKSWTDKLDARVFMPGAPIPRETKSEELVMGLVNSLINQYPIDVNRIYIIGISMGGVATYDLVCRYPDVFAAAVPICGAINPERLSAVKNVNFLIFHGEKDDEIPSICGREAYKALCSVGANVDYIEFVGAGHDCWTAAFNYPSLLPWLFSQHKTGKDTLDNNLAYTAD